MSKLMLKVLCLALTLLFSLLFLYNLYQQQTPPERPPADCQVVGIALSADGATVSRRSGDGVFEDVGSVKGLGEYTELMERLSSRSSEHPSPPYFSMEDMWNDWPRQLLRSARKSLGLPASFDVGILAGMLKPAVGLVGAKPKAPLSALVSFPALHGLNQEDISDAASYVGLRGLRGGYERHPHELVAAYAGHGLGLDVDCDNQRNRNGSGNNCPMRPTLLVEHTGTALLAHHDYMRKALELPAPSMILKTSFDMGSDQAPAEEDFRDFILQFLYQEYMVRVRDVPSSVTVIITGSALGLADGKVERATKAVIEALGSRPEMFVENPEYIAARGAAVLAWRASRSEEVMEL